MRYTARFRLAVDALRVCLGHIKRQRNGFRSVGFLAHRVTSCLKSFCPLEVAPPEAVFRTSAELRATWSGCRASARKEMPKAVRGRLWAGVNSQRRCLLSAESPAVMQRTAETRIPVAFLVFPQFEGQRRPFRWGQGTEPHQAGEPCKGAAVAPTGSMGTLFAAAGSSTPSALRRQMSRSPLLLRKDTVMPLRLRASTLLRIW